MRSECKANIRLLTCLAVVILAVGGCRRGPPPVVVTPRTPPSSAEEAKREADLIMQQVRSIQNMIRDKVLSMFSEVEQENLDAELQIKAVNETVLEVRQLSEKIDMELKKSPPRSRT